MNSRGARMKTQVAIVSCGSTPFSRVRVKIDFTDPRDEIAVPVFRPAQAGEGAGV